ncbi:MAG: hypothetical protein COA38_05250 [Fluviicola sp.]|nr:MAG: hypothetical protein COA38_05250 [Fluviicola sp.]
MNCKVHFYLLNDDFSVEHAEANHEGKESENNRLHEWEDELDITTEVTGMEMHEGASFPLQGQHPDGKDFHFDIKGMRLFELLGEQKTVLGCSESLFDSYEWIEGDNYTLKIYLKDYEPLTNPIPGMYITAQEFPKELMF